VLGQIFQSEPDGEPEPIAAVSPIAGLDAKCAALVRDVITKDYWSEGEFADLAKRHGLMPLGRLRPLTNGRLRPMMKPCSMNMTVTMSQMTSRKR
jgi:hypothetical protein